MSSRSCGRGRLPTWVVVMRSVFCCSAILSQPSPIQCDQPFPMSFRGWLVVTPALREGEAVVDGGIHLQLTRIGGTFEQAAQLLDQRRGGQLVMLRATDVELAFGFPQIEV